MERQVNTRSKRLLEKEVMVLWVLSLILTQVKGLQSRKLMMFLSIYPMPLWSLEKLSSCGCSDILILWKLSMESDFHQVIKANDDLTPEHHQFLLYQLLRSLKYIHTCIIYPVWIHNFTLCREIVCWITGFHFNFLHANLMLRARSTLLIYCLELGKIACSFWVVRLEVLSNASEISKFHSYRKIFCNKLLIPNSLELLYS